MKTIRILSIIGIFVAFIGFIVGIFSNEPYNDFESIKGLLIFVTLYLGAQGIISLALIKLKKGDERLEKLEKDLEELKKQNKGD